MEGGSGRGRSWSNPAVKTEFMELPTTQAERDADEVDMEDPLMDGMIGRSGDMSTSSSAGRMPPNQTQPQRPRSGNQVQKLREELEKANGTIGHLRKQLEEVAGENASLNEQLDQELQQKYDIGVIVEWETRKLEKKFERERETRLKAEQNLRRILREKKHASGGTSTDPVSSTVEEDEVVFVGEINPDGHGVDEGVGRQPTSRQMPLDPQRQSSQVINEGPSSSHRQGPPLFSNKILTPTPVVRMPGRNLFKSGPSATATSGPYHGQRSKVNRDDKKKNVASSSANASGAGRPGCKGSLAPLRGQSVTLNTSAGHQLVGPDPKEPSAYYECSCGKSFGLRTLFLLHLRTKKYGKIFSCRFCDQRFEIHATLKTHVNKIHKRAYDDSKYGCGICGRLGFMTYAEVREHRQSAHGLSQ